MEKNKEIQQKVMELKLLEQQINQLQQQISAFKTQQIEFRNLKQNLKNIEQINPNTEMFSPIGAGIFIKTEIKDTKKILMNIGANTHVTKTIGEASDMIDHQIKEMEEAVKELELNLQGVALRAQELEKEVITLSAKSK